MFLVDSYLGLSHDMGKYNCWDFIRDVWLEVKDQDIGKRTPKTVTLKNLKSKFIEEESQFKKIDSPISPCIVLFRRKKSLPHVGVYLEGFVLHLPEKQTSRMDKLEIVGKGFTEIGFYTCK
jgi:hypothetical protein